MVVSGFFNLSGSSDEAKSWQIEGNANSGILVTIWQPYTHYERWARARTVFFLQDLTLFASFYG